MKQIFLSFCLLVIAATVFGQHPIGNDSFALQTLGSSATLVKSKGAIGSDSGFVNAAYADTTAANRGNKLKNYPGAQIRVGDSIWMRNTTATKWINITGSGGTAFDSSILRGVYMDTVYLINDTTLRACKAATCWDIHIGSSLITFEGDTTVINKIKIKNLLSIPLTDTTNAIKYCGALIYDTINEHFYVDDCLDGVHNYWACNDCGYNTVVQLDDSTYKICRLDGTCDTIQFTQGPQGVTSWSGGTTGMTPNTATTGAVTMAGVLVEANGGTHQSTYTTGDILYASASNTLSKLPIGTAAQHLVVRSGIPAWVDTATSGSTYTANNGITLSGSTFQWRGTLNQNTTITGAGFYSAFNGGRLEAGQGAAVAAANDLTLGADGNTFSITGATQINAITTTNWQAGSVINLVFASTPTVKHNTAGGAGTAPLLLSGAIDFTAAANDVLTLLYDGTNWHETARKLAAVAGGQAALGVTRIGWGSNANVLTGNDSLLYNFTSRRVTIYQSKFVQAATTNDSSQNALVLSNLAVPVSAGTTSLASPAIIFTSQGWRSNATAVAQTSHWAIRSVATTGAAQITSTLEFMNSVGTGIAPTSLTRRVWFDEAGGLFATTGTFNTNGSATSTGYIVLGASSAAVYGSSGNTSTTSIRLGSNTSAFTGYAATGDMLFQGGSAQTAADPAITFAIARPVSFGVGTASNTAGGTTVTGSGTKFLEYFKIGDQIRMLGGTAETQTITAIASNTSMTTTTWTNVHNAPTSYTATPLLYDFTVASSGFTGWGTNTPAALLDIAASTADWPQIIAHASTDLTTGVDGALIWTGTEWHTWDGTTKQVILATPTVSSVSPTSPNRTIKVTINGTDYYIAAKTTND